MSWRDRIVRGLLSKGESAVLEQARADAERRAAGGAWLPGLPSEPQMLQGQGMYVPGPVGAVRDVADRYMAGRNFGMPFQTQYRPIDKSAAARVAEVYDALPMYDPNAQGSYNALARETLAQYQAMKNAGMRITPVDATTYPYGTNPRAAVKDIADNQHMAVFKSEAGFGGPGGALVQHPLLAQSGVVEQGHPMTYNDLFRAVHDYFGHAKEGFGFRGAGEDNAFRSHAAMFSPEARPAMTTETRGQNSWLNYGPYGDFNRTANQVETQYAPQKVALLPDWVMKYAVPGAAGVGVGASALGGDEARAAPQLTPDQIAQLNSVDRMPWVPRQYSDMLQPLGALAAQDQYQ